MGLLTNAVQTLAGVLLPSATAFLLLLCNDEAVLGPWANTLRTNLFTGAVIAVLVMLSVLLTASVLFPKISETHIVAILMGGSAVALGATITMLLHRLERPALMASLPSVSRAARDAWRMPPLPTLPPARLTVSSRIWLVVLRGYLLIAGGLVLVRIAELVSAGH